MPEKPSVQGRSHIPPTHLCLAPRRQRGESSTSTPVLPKGRSPGWRKPPRSGIAWDQGDPLPVAFLSSDIVSSVLLLVPAPHQAPESKPGSAGVLRLLLKGTPSLTGSSNCFCGRRPPGEDSAPVEDRGMKIPVPSVADGNRT